MWRKSIELIDVEKIEIVRGPSAALYGPNAVTGVINIITRRLKKEGPNIALDVQAGEQSTFIGNGAAGYNYKDKFSMILSANHQKRDRFEENYYDLYNDRYVSKPVEIWTYAPRPLSDPDIRYPETELAMDKFGVNTFLRFRPSEELAFDLSAGHQESRDQKVNNDQQASPITTNDSNTNYIDLKVKSFDFSGQISYLTGSQEPLGIKLFPWDFSTLDVLLEYEQKWNKLEIRPGISYRRALYDADFIAGEQELTTIAAFLRADYQLTNAWRFIAAIRGDKYNNPDKIYPSWQAGSTWDINDSNMIRAVYSRSNRAPVMLDNYIDFPVHVERPGTVIDMHYSGNKDLDLTTMDMLELGYRTRLHKNLLFDCEAFYSRIKNYSHNVTLENSLTSKGGTVYSVYRSAYENLDVSAEQYGFTAGVSYALKNDFQARLFGTIQYTEIFDHSPGLSMEIFGSNTTVDKSKHDATPLFYGGIDFNYKPLEKLNINTNAYYYTDNKSRYSEFKDPDKNIVERTFDIDSKLILNCKVSYVIWKNASVYLNIRNILNDTSQEFAWADDIGRTILCGLRFEY